MTPLLLFLALFAAGRQDPVSPPESHWEHKAGPKNPMTDEPGFDRYDLMGRVLNRGEDEKVPLLTVECQKGVITGVALSGRQQLFNFKKVTFLIVPFQLRFDDARPVDIEIRLPALSTIAILPRDRWAAILSAKRFLIGAPGTFPPVPLIFRFDIPDTEPLKAGCGADPIFNKP